MSYNDRWSWKGSQPERYSYESGKGGKGGYDYTWGWPRGGKSKGKGNGGLYAAVDAITTLETNRAWREQEAAEKEEKRLKEEADRKKEEMDAETRKREREEMYDRIKAESEQNLKKLKEDNEHILKRVVGSTPKGKKKAAAADDDDDDDDDDNTASSSWADALRSARKQTVRAPVQVQEWKAWECDAPNAKIVREHFPGTVKSKDVLGCGILEVAEAVIDCEKCPKEKPLREDYKKVAKRDAPARWSKLELVTGVISEIVRR